MKIEIKYYHRFVITSIIIILSIISSNLLSSCAGCSRSGIKFQQKKNRLSTNSLADFSLNSNQQKINTNSDKFSKPNTNEKKNDNIAYPQENRNIVSVLTWNLENFGKSKSEQIIDYISNIIINFDLVAIQEVVAGPGGSQAVARLQNALNRKGNKWDYTISDPTSGINSYKRERYAFLWKTNRMNIQGKPWLEVKYSNKINREPFLATFNFKGKQFTLVSFHAITKKMQPETEIKYFKFFPDEYPSKNLIFNGDFNCPETHTVFNPLKKMGYRPILINQKTTLKRETVNNQTLSSAFDNIFYNANKINFINSGVIRFDKSFNNLSEAREVSDHIPVWFQFSIN